MKKVKFFAWCEMLSFLALTVTFVYFGYRGYFKGEAILLNELFPRLMLIFVALIVVFGICNMVSAVGVGSKIAGDAPARSLWHLVVLMKLAFIPMFGVNFLFGFVFGVFGMFFIVTLPYMLALMAAAWFAMMSSSGYCIRLILRARQQGSLGAGAAVGHCVLQLIFVLDVVDLLFLRKAMKQ